MHILRFRTLANESSQNDARIVPVNDPQARQLDSFSHFPGAYPVRSHQVCFGLPRTSTVGCVRLRLGAGSWPSIDLPHQNRRVWELQYGTKRFNPRYSCTAAPGVIPRLWMLPLSQWRVLQRTPDPMPATKMQNG